MPNRMDAMSCCSICLITDGQGLRSEAIESAVPWSTSPGLENRTNKDSAIRFRCPNCGQFVVTLCDSYNLKSRRSLWQPYQLSALLREQAVSKRPIFWLRDGMPEYGPLATDETFAIIERSELLARWPRTVPERIDRFLCNLARMSHCGGQPLNVPPEDTALAFAEHTDESRYHFDALFTERLIVGSTLETVVTPAGWARFHDLTRTQQNLQSPVFVAMWYGGKDHEQAMTSAFEEGIRPALNNAGWKAIRADLVEHNEWIMDQVLGDIRTAPFVVADFTGQRNGVYMEAGFARGLGTQVVHTCRRDQMKEAHFDTAQLNHVLWDSPEDLATKLYHRVLGTIGPGPNFKGRQAPM